MATLGILKPKFSDAGIIVTCNVYSNASNGCLDLSSANYSLSETGTGIKERRFDSARENQLDTRETIILLALRTNFFEDQRLLEQLFISRPLEVFIAIGFLVYRISEVREDLKLDRSYRSHRLDFEELLEPVL